MHDFLSKPLKVNDTIVTMDTTFSTPRLILGKVKAFTQHYVVFDVYGDMTKLEATEVRKTAPYKVVKVNES